MEKELTPEQKVIKLLAERCLMTDTTLVAAALEDEKVADKIINAREDLIPDDSGECGECDHESLSNEEIQIVFDNDEEEQKKEAN